MIHPPIKIEIRFIGPIAEHNLLCWFCNENPAVYDMNDFVFRPCWICQKLYLKQKGVTVGEWFQNLLFGKDLVESFQD